MPQQSEYDPLRQQSEVVADTAAGEIWHSLSYSEQCRFLQYLFVHLCLH